MTSLHSGKAPVGYTIQKLLTLRQPKIGRDAQKKKLLTLRETARGFTFLPTGEASQEYTLLKLHRRSASQKLIGK